MYEKEKRSPLKEKPLRQAGQGVQELLTDLIQDKYLPLVVLTTMAFGLMLTEWFRYIFHQPPHPYQLTVLFLIVLFYSIIRGRKILRQAKHIRQGRDGEKIVGQILDDLKFKGFYALHDIQVKSKSGKRFNIDHVLIGPRGVFTIETKTWSKSKYDKIESDGKSLYIGGFKSEKDILAQPKAEAAWINEFINERTGKAPYAKSILAFPGWFIDPSAQKFAKDYGVILVNPQNALGAFIENEIEKINPEDVVLFVKLMKSYIRNFDYE